MEQGPCVCCWGLLVQGALAQSCSKEVRHFLLGSSLGFQKDPRWVTT